ncbi:nitrous oxide-stimulated promoter family protein [Paenibacillus sp. M1]|uniref:Nitrous oxide-stimulated promoter family protein n=1 Tax=Paenibacillus haidiansis TaxID=1574488 RepID=A0ABU7VWZ0_9BACL
MNRTYQHSRQAQRIEGPRITREKITIRHMIGIYCRGAHKKSRSLDSLGGRWRRTSFKYADDRMGSGLCEECKELERYAMKRLSFCRFGEDKSTCVSCPVHCYAPVQRDMIKRVMRYAGPRMLLSHPVLTIRHMIDGRARIALTELD